MYLTWYFPDGNLRIDPRPLRPAINTPSDSCPMRAQCVPKMIEIHCYSMIWVGCDKNEKTPAIAEVSGLSIGAPPGT